MEVFDDSGSAALEQSLSCRCLLSCPFLAEEFGLLDDGVGCFLLLVGRTAFLCSCSSPEYGISRSDPGLGGASDVSGEPWRHHADGEFRPVSPESSTLNRYRSGHAPCWHSRRQRARFDPEGSGSSTKPGVPSELQGTRQRCVPRVAHHHPVDPILDSAKDGGGISEPSGQRLEEQLRSNCQATRIGPEEAIPVLLPSNPASPGCRSSRDITPVNDTLPHRGRPCLRTKSNGRPQLRSRRLYYVMLTLQTHLSTSRTARMSGLATA